MHTNDHTPLVSVIAVSYNHERWILDALESIGGQTFRDFELIYADDASADRSVGIATAWLSRQHFPIRTVIHRQNRGLCRTLNEVLALCRGRYLQSVSCDDILFPDKLARHVQLLEAASADVALVHSGIEIIDADGAVITHDHLDLARAVDAELPGLPFVRLLDGNAMSALTALIRTDAVRSVGGYDENLRYEDWDMFLRLGRNFRFLYSPYVSVRYRLLGSGLHATITDVDRYWTLRKHVDHGRARQALMWTVYRLYEEGRLTSEIRADFLDCARRFRDMRNVRNQLIRMRVPGAISNRLVRAKAALSRPRAAPVAHNK